MLFRAALYSLLVSLTFAQAGGQRAFTPAWADVQGGAIINIPDATGDGATKIECVFTHKDDNTKTKTVESPKFTDSQIQCPVPAGFTAGDYTIKYKVTKDGNVADADPKVTITLAATPTVTSVAPQALLWNAQDTELVLQGEGLKGPNVQCHLAMLNGTKGMVPINGAVVGDDGKSLKCVLPSVGAYTGTVKVFASVDGQTRSTTSADLKIVDTRYMQMHCDLTVGRATITQQGGEGGKWSGLLIEGGMSATVSITQNPDGTVTETYTPGSSGNTASGSGSGQTEGSEGSSAGSDPEEQPSSDTNKVRTLQADSTDTTDNTGSANSNKVTIVDGPYQLHVHEKTIPEGGDCTTAAGHFIKWGQDPVPVKGNELKAEGKKMQLSVFGVDEFTHISDIASGKLSMVLHDANGARVDCCNWKQSSLTDTLAVMGDSKNMIGFARSEDGQVKAVFGDYFKDAADDDTFTLKIKEKCDEDALFEPAPLKSVSASMVATVKKADKEKVIPHLALGGTYTALGKSLAVFDSEGKQTDCGVIEEPTTLEARDIARVGEDGDQDTPNVGSGNPNNGAEKVVPVGLLTVAALLFAAVL
eukprot:TRINITY_DN55209_c0_g1_i1.p1 TRINITY_DN55209_c0_g1~~TRINITY_DN55209_c0_g1_i1.p1  ORF type:complete len:588 (+),score=88.83 TRINITY_DN55209_c0_g1_i1:44-1807(+)